MRSYEEQQKAITEAIAQFPATFSLRAFPNDTFRVSRSSSYVNDAGVVTLYTERLCRAATPIKGDIWESFAKGSLAELKAEIVSNEPAKHLTATEHDEHKRRALIELVTGKPYSEGTVTVDAEVWKAVRFLIEGMAFMETVKHDHPDLHRNVVKLARCVENAEVSK